MFGWFKKIRRKKDNVATFQKYFIVLPGTHSIEIVGITGISLKEVPRAVWDIHKGLRYCVSSKQMSDLKRVSFWNMFRERVGVDIKHLLFNQQLFKTNTYQIQNESVMIYFIDDRRLE